MAGKELATQSRGGYLATSDDYMDLIAQEAQTMKGGGDGKAFMKFDGNSGNYSYGADDEELPLGSQLAVNMRSYLRGWVIWVDGNVVYEDMKPLGTPQTVKGALPDHGPYEEDEGPVEQYTIEMRMLDEPHVEMVFQANNSSKRRAMAALLKEFSATYKSHPGEIPIIELDEREFETTTKGKGKGRKITKHAPLLKIVDWMPEEELLAMSEGAQEDYQDEEDERPSGRSNRRAAEAEEDERPARRSGRRADPETEEEEDERPARRSGRRADPEPEEEEDERPARRSGRRADPEPEEEEEERPARRSGRRADPEPEEEEEEERPARRTARRQADDGDEQPATRRRGRFA